MLAHDVVSAADEAALKAVEELERTARGWFHVEYSRYERKFIAYYRGRDCPPGGLILRAAAHDHLVMLMDRVAPPGWRMPDLPLVSARPRGSGER
ncbi:hypothetical protein ABZ897_55650 [Nonomuraea sp. NPDC046802]|uniref:hypothetical protein n=1 Tax=Nonomuraea sp. NPDC046802 TaxID=3154919 RepID=UPI00340E3403